MVRYEDQQRYMYSRDMVGDGEDPYAPFYRGGSPGRPVCSSAGNVLGDSVPGCSSVLDGSCGQNMGVDDTALSACFGLGQSFSPDFFPQQQISTWSVNPDVLNGHYMGGYQTFPTGCTYSPVPITPMSAMTFQEYSNVQCYGTPSMNSSLVSATNTGMTFTNTELTSTNTESTFMDIEATFTDIGTTFMDTPSSADLADPGSCMAQGIYSSKNGEVNESENPSWESSALVDIHIQPNFTPDCKTIDISAVGSSVDQWSPQSVTEMNDLPAITPSPGSSTESQTPAREDLLEGLVKLRSLPEPVKYRDIAKREEFVQAGWTSESTLRGRHRAHTLDRESRPRKATWSDSDDHKLMNAASVYIDMESDPRNPRARESGPWLKVVQHIIDHGGPRRGPTTCKKRYEQIMQTRRPELFAKNGASQQASRSHHRG